MRFLENFFYHIKNLYQNQTNFLKNINSLRYSILFNNNEIKRNLKKNPNAKSELKIYYRNLQLSLKQYRYLLEKLHIMPLTQKEYDWLTTVLITLKKKDIQTFGPEIALKYLWKGLKRNNKIIRDNEV